MTTYPATPHMDSMTSPEKVEVALLEDDVHTKKLTKQILWKLDTR